MRSGRWGGGELQSRSQIQGQKFVCNKQQDTGLFTASKPDSDGMYTRIKQETCLLYMGKICSQAAIPSSSSNIDGAAAPSSSSNTDGAAALSPSTGGRSAAALPSDGRYLYMLQNVRGGWGSFRIIEQDIVGIKSEKSLGMALEEAYNKDRSLLFRFLYGDSIAIGYLKVSLYHELKGCWRLRLEILINE